MMTLLFEYFLVHGPYIIIVPLEDSSVRIWGCGTHLHGFHLVPHLPVFTIRGLHSDITPPSLQIWLHHFPLSGMYFFAHSRTLPTCRLLPSLFLPAYFIFRASYFPPLSVCGLRVPLLGHF